MRRIAFAAFAFFALSLAAPASADDAAWGDWRWLPDYDAVFTEADALAPNSTVKPRLVVVCNNLVRITYLEWPTDLGIEHRDDLPNFVEVDYVMKPIGDGTELWVVDRPKDDITRFIYHARHFPGALIDAKAVTMKVKDPENKLDLTARFGLEGLGAITSAHNMPCGR